jgi:hypothetical protein
MALNRVRSCEILDRIVKQAGAGCHEELRDSAVRPGISVPEDFLDRPLIHWVTLLRPESAQRRVAVVIAMAFGAVDGIQPGQFTKRDGGKVTASLPEKSDADLVETEAKTPWMG